MKHKKLIGLLAIPIVAGGIGIGALTTNQAHAVAANQETQVGETGDKSEPGDKPDAQEKETPGKTDTDSKTETDTND